MIQFKEERLFGRYITFEHITPILYEYGFIPELLGESVNKVPIYMYKLGTGPKKLLLWSQMHGNESTTTKALIDFMNRCRLDVSFSGDLLDRCTLYIIPMLNPDGFKAYTRINANQVDLNRDALDLTQPESKILRAIYDQIKPDFCFNLHDQRTIFSVGETSYPATVSFLAPAAEESKSITPSRAKAMEVIVKMNEQLQELIPNQVGRYDDGFNINCVGDMFTSLNTPTILFEAGHYNLDYERDTTRVYIYEALVTAITYIAFNDVNGVGVDSYFEIPENGKNFVDILLYDDVTGMQSNVGILFKEILQNNSIVFMPTLEKIGNLQGFYGHKETSLSSVGVKEVSENVFGQDLLWEILTKIQQNQRYLKI